MVDYRIEAINNKQYLVTNQTVKNKQLIFNVTDLFHVVYNKEHVLYDICDIYKESKKLLIYITYNNETNQFELKNSISEDITVLDLNKFINASKSCIEENRAIKNHTYLIIKIAEHKQLIFEYLIIKNMLLTDIEIKSYMAIKEINTGNTTLVCNEILISKDFILSLNNISVSNKSYNTSDIKDLYIQLILKDSTINITNINRIYNQSFNMINSVIKSEPTTESNKLLIKEFNFNTIAFDVREAKKYMFKHLTQPKLNLNKYMLAGY